MYNYVNKQPIYNFIHLLYNDKKPAFAGFQKMSVIGFDFLNPSGYRRP